MENIRLKKDNIFRVGIQDQDGNDTGNILEFDLEDLELPFKAQEAEYQHKKNIEKLKADFVLADKKPEKKGKKLMSSREEEKLRALREFYSQEEKALDLFLGEGGTRKLLNGRKPYYEMFDDILEYLEPIVPKLELHKEDIVEKIKKKYSSKKEDNVIE
jgi:hypothetical protein|nr:MAG TPA: hypothetical protein [Caudoviricetes sp.]